MDDRDRDDGVWMNTYQLVSDAGAGPIDELSELVSGHPQGRGCNSFSGLHDCVEAVARLLMALEEILATESCDSLREANFKLRELDSTAADLAVDCDRQLESSQRREWRKKSLAARRALRIVIKGISRILEMNWEQTLFAHPRKQAA